MLDHRIVNISENLDSIIDARIFEKGNNLIYELDSCNRLLRLFKTAIRQLESSLVTQIQGEQVEKFKRMANLVDVKSQKFEQYV